MRVDEIDKAILAARQSLEKRGVYRELKDFEKHPDWFHPAQVQAWNSTATIVAICAGWQSGKTVSLSHWLLREIQRRGCGDYGAFSSTYKLLDRKFLPELKNEFKNIAEYKAASMQFVLTEQGCKTMWGSPTVENPWDKTPTVIQLGYAENPDSLESATMKAVVWDEPGQRLVPEQSFRTVHSRLMVNRGRMCLASRPYEFNWFQRLVHDGLTGRNDNVDVITFPSWINPANPPEDDVYWSDLRASMPAWLFDMLYGGKFTRPAGAIYDCFNREKNVVKPFKIPRNWKRFAGHDFGPVHMAAVFAAQSPVDGKVYVYRTYLDGNKTVKEHVEAFKVDDVISADGVFDNTTGNRKLKTPVTVGGTRSEDEWRNQFTAAGWPIARPPIWHIDAQIERVYAAIKSGQLVIFDNLTNLIAELETYSRKVNDQGEPLAEIEDESKYHRHAALRYLMSVVNQSDEVKQVSRGGMAITKHEPDFWDDEDTGVKTEPIRLSRIR